MKSYFIFFIFIFFLAAGFPQNTGATATALTAEKPQATANVPSGKAIPAADTDQTPAKAVQKPPDAIDEKYTDDEAYDEADDTFKEEKVTIADPIEPFNRAMHTFNDRMYFWLLKPVALGYKFVVPEPARLSVKNFYSNLKFPIRFVNCLLQTDFSGAGIEVGRFTINTIWGIGGLLDPSSSKDIDLKKQNTDFGQTLGLYGVGHGFYIVWPVLGPSSPRDSVDIAGEYFLDPLSYFGPWYTGLGIRPFKMINSASLVIGDYESLIGAAIDPYISIRDAYAQYRMKEINARKSRSLFFKSPESARTQPERTQESLKKD